MNLLRSLKRELRMSLLLITHDMGLVAQMADRVMVMYAGQIIEEGTVFEIFDHPSHPYTKALLAAVPSMEQNPEKMLQAIEGTVPENYGQMTGCRFRDRCPYRKQGCEAPQELEEIKAEEHRRHRSFTGCGAGRAKEAEQSAEPYKNTEPLLKVEHLKKYYPQNRPIFGRPTSWIRAADDVSLELYLGETLGLVGESGCGKSTLGRMIAGLEAPDSGCIWYKGQELTAKGGRGYSAVRTEIQMVFQDSYSSLNPRKQIFQILSEPMLTTAWRISIRFIRRQSI